MIKRKIFLRMVLITVLLVMSQIMISCDYYTYTHVRADYDTIEELREDFPDYYFFNFDTDVVDPISYSADVSYKKSKTDNHIYDYVLHGYNISLRKIEIQEDRSVSFSVNAYQCFSFSYGNDWNSHADYLVAYPDLYYPIVGDYMIDGARCLIYEREDYWFGGIADIDRTTSINWITTASGYYNHRMGIIFVIDMKSYSFNFEEHIYCDSEDDLPTNYILSTDYILPIAKSGIENRYKGVE